MQATWRGLGPLLRFQAQVGTIPLLNLTVPQNGFRSTTGPMFPRTQPRVVFPRSIRHQIEHEHRDSVEGYIALLEEPPGTEAQRVDNIDAISRYLRDAAFCPDRDAWLCWASMASGVSASNPCRGVGRRGRVGHVSSCAASQAMSRGSDSKVSSAPTFSAPAPIAPLPIRPVSRLSLRNQA